MKSTLLNPKTLFLTTLVGVCVFTFLDQLRFPDSSRNFLGDTKRAELSANGPITQVFQAKENGLEGLQIFMGDTDLGLGERIDFTLSDASCKTVIHQSNRTMFSLPVTRDIRFTFPALPASIGEAYCLSVEYYPGFLRKKERPYIRVTEDERAKDIFYTDHGKEKVYIGRSLQLRPLYAPQENSIASRVEALENRLSQYKPVFMKGHMLTLGTFVFLLSLGFFSWVARQRD